MLDAYHLAAVGTRDDLRRAIAAGTAGSPATALLSAVAAQYDGDVEGAARILRHQLRTLTGHDRAAVADTLAPIAVMRHDNAMVLSLAEALDEGGWAAAARAFRALVAAVSGARDVATQQSDAARAALADEQDDVVRFRVLQRLARTAYYLGAYEDAVDLALQSAKLASRMHAWRAAAAGYSIAYNVHHNVTGDAVEADRYAGLWRNAAAASQDESFLQVALVAEYELAVQFGDLPRTEELERLLRARLLPEQYTERFLLALSHAVARGATDLRAMRTLLQVLRDIAKRSRGEWALCTALIAVADAALADDDAARRNLRAAATHLGRTLSSDPAFERRYRRLARASIAVARMLVGDEVGAARTLAARESREGDGEDRLPSLTRDGRLDEAPPALRGMARIFAAAFATRRGLDAPAGLTAAEIEVLRLLALGWSAGRIANETNRSVNTIYNHTRSILAKLEASRASEAVAIARERRLLI